MSKISAMVDYQLSTPYEKRFVIVDKETGEILDDAQGYGYKSAKKAYSAYSYKTRGKIEEQEKIAEKKVVKKWMRENKDFIELMDQISFEIAKGQKSERLKFDTKLIRELLKEKNMTLPFSAWSLLRVWREEKNLQYSKKESEI